MKFVMKKEVCGSCEQCTRPTERALALLKRVSPKKNGKKKVKLRRRMVLFSNIQMHNYYALLLLYERKMMYFHLKIHKLV